MRIGVHAPGAKGPCFDRVRGRGRRSATGAAERVRVAFPRGAVFPETVTGTPQGGVISPLLSNIYLHAFDRAFTERGIGELVRYADDWVAVCRSRAEAEAALAAAGEVLAELGLELHPDKTRVVDLREGREGFDFLGWHFRARVSGRLLERGIRRYYLHRWPRQAAMKRIRAKVKAKTGRNRTWNQTRHARALRP